MKKNLVFVLCAFMILALFSLEGCKKKEEPSIIGEWVNTKADYYDEYDEFVFYDNGHGEYMKWLKNETSRNATSDYILAFSYSLSNNTLVLDYGFNYINTYYEVYVYDSILTMNFGTLETNWYNLRSHYPQTQLFTDYTMRIISSWDIYDSEKSRTYLITCRADGTYESQSSENGQNGIIETGTYKVDKSRVMFESLTEGSLLNGRVFMISFCFHDDWHSGKIHLISENNIMIYGNQI